MTMSLLQAEDLPAYKALIDACFGISNDLSAYQKYSENTAYTIFVAKEGQQIIGSATQYAVDLFTFDFQPSLMLFNVAVLPGRRREKIAQKLLRHIIENAKAQGYRSISLTCLADAYPAHKLYESAGFTRADSVKYALYL